MSTESARREARARRFVNPLHTSPRGMPDHEMRTLACFVRGKGSALIRLVYRVMHGRWARREALASTCLFFLAGQGSETRRLSFVRKATHGLNLAHL